MSAIHEKAPRSSQPAASYIVSELLHPAEAAAEMRVTVDTIRRWIKSGKLESVVLPSGRLRVPTHALAGLERLPRRLENGASKSQRRAA